MAYPEDLLSTNEQVIVHSHPHFKMLIWPVFWLIVTVGLGVWLSTLTGGLATPWDNVALIAIAVVGVLLVCWLFLAPLIRWRTTHFIVTTDRLIAREGVIKRTGIDIPMTRINSVQFEHGLVDRIFGCGTLIIESASDEPLRFDDIPAVERVHTVIYREVNDNPYDDFGPADGHPQQRGRR
ncbi:PH domain-containing protein [Amycolatopsis sp.]|uniref:PH domain-containing protein n=1 Tax=Amycolatopsis sp. TaxID=37632 RepID=UPI002D150F02|nr:PH domain-containing protein [Amycolatopsis sp.]HVV13183.1 PH domain-containing protein [Amycolatopsis sp.]